MGDYISTPPPPPPPPPSPPLLPPSLPSEVDPNGSSSSLSTLALLILSVLASVFLIFLGRRIFRLLSSSRRSSSSVTPASLLARSNSSSAAPAVTSPSDLQDKKKSALIDSLPLFKLGSPLAALSKSSPDCAVCLRSFHPGEDLRLLPACCHAFHSGCVETWIRSSPSCPLCRATVALPQPPLPSPESPSAGPLLVKMRAEDEPRHPPLTLPLPLPSPPRRLTYTIEPSSFDDDDNRSGEDDVEAAVSPRIQRPPDSGPLPPGDDVAAAVGGDASRGWLKDYMDRVLSSSRSSSFWSTTSSFRFSGRWFPNHEEYGTGGDERYVMDLELSAWGEAEADDDDYDGVLAALCRWIAGM